MSAQSYGRMLRWVMDELRGDSNAKDVYATIVTYCHPDARLHPTAKTLAGYAGMGLTMWSEGWKVCKHLFEVEEIRDARGHRVGYHYTQLLVPPADLGQISPDPPERIKEPSQIRPAGSGQQSPDPPERIAIDHYRSVLRNPPTPLKRGVVPEPALRITRADRKRALKVLELNFGRCPHETRCRSSDECRAKLAAEYATTRVSSEREAVEAMGR